jgi:F-type H+-transporting ATPase subunit delta
LLKSPAVRRAEKEPLIRQAFGGKASDLVLNFLLVLNEKERLALLRPVANALRDLLDERAKRVRVRVRTAVDLDEDQKRKLQETLRKQLTLEPVLDVRVEPELLGGMIVRVGDTVFDSSVRTRIETLRNQLLARSSYEIQSGRDRFRSDA